MATIDSQRGFFRFTHWISCRFVLSPEESPVFIGLNDTGGSQYDFTEVGLNGRRGGFGRSVMRGKGFDSRAVW